MRWVLCIQMAVAICADHVLDVSNEKYLLNSTLGFNSIICNRFTASAMSVVVCSMFIKYYSVFILSMLYFTSTLILINIVAKYGQVFFYNLLGLISIMAGQNIFQLCNILLYPIVIGGYWPSDIAIYCFFIYMSTGFELIFSPSIFFFVHLFEINNRHWPFYWFNEGDKYTISFSNLLARKN